MRLLYCIIAILFIIPLANASECSDYGGSCRDFCMGGEIRSGWDCEGKDCCYETELLKCERILGDINSDGCISSDDVEFLNGFLDSRHPLIYDSCFDCNQDFKIDSADIGCISGSIDNFPCSENGDDDRNIAGKAFSTDKTDKSGYQSVLLTSIILIGALVFIFVQNRKSD